MSEYRPQSNGPKVELEGIREGAESTTFSHHRPHLSPNAETFEPKSTFARA